MSCLVIISDETPKARARTHTGAREHAHTNKHTHTQNKEHCGPMHPMFPSTTSRKRGAKCSYMDTIIQYKRSPSYDEVLSRLSTRMPTWPQVGNIHKYRRATRNHV